MGHVLRGALKTPLFDVIALAYNSPSVRSVATWALGSALAGSHLTQMEPAAAVNRAPSTSSASDTSPTASPRAVAN